MLDDCANCTVFFTLHLYIAWGKHDVQHTHTHIFVCILVFFSFVLSSLFLSFLQSQVRYICIIPWPSISETKLKMKKKNDLYIEIYRKMHTQMSWYIKQVAAIKWLYRIFFLSTLSCALWYNNHRRGIIVALHATTTTKIEKKESCELNTQMNFFFRYCIEWLSCGNKYNRIWIQPEREENREKKNANPQIKHFKWIMNYQTFRWQRVAMRFHDITIKSVTHFENQCSVTHSSLCIIHLHSFTLWSSFQFSNLLCDFCFDSIFL